MNKVAFLSFDVEELSDALCLKTKEQKEKAPSAVDGQEKFLSLCQEMGLKANLFVLSSRLEKDLPFLKKAMGMGFEIGLHGYEHALAPNYSLEEFLELTRKGKTMAEKALGVSIKGYRAPGWALTKAEHDSLPGLGFRYSSSLSIGRKWAGFYPNPDLSDFTKNDEFVYERSGFYEFTLPTVKEGVYKDLPLGGGVLPRFFPMHDVLSFFKRRIQEGCPLVLNAHPFEFSSYKLPSDLGLPFHDDLYLRKGRKHWAERLKQIICLLKENGYTFFTFSEYLDSLAEQGASEAETKERK